MRTGRTKKRKAVIAVERHVTAMHASTATVHHEPCSTNCTFCSGSGCTAVYLGPSVAASRTFQVNARARTCLQQEPEVMAVF